MRFGRAWLTAVALSLLWAAPALATRNPQSASLNNGSLWTPDTSGCNNCKSNNGAVATVCPGDMIEVDYTVAISGSSGSRNWQWTGYTIEGGSEVCVDTANFTSSGTWTVTFNITAPVTPGTYDLTLDADNNNTCSTSNSSPNAGILALVNAIVVQDPNSLACCTPIDTDDDTCNGIDDDCDGSTDEDAVDCQLCGEFVDACIYIMIDRTGSMPAADLDDEVDAVQDFLDALAALPDAPPVAIGTFGCNGSGFPADGSGHQGFCTGNADDACTLQTLSDSEVPAPYGDDDGSTADGDHYAAAERAGTSNSSTGTHFACALDVVNTELGHGSCPEGKDKILIFVTDGGDQDSLANTTAAADHLKNVHGVEIFTLLFGDITPANTARAQVVASDPDATHYYETPDSADLLDILDQISGQIACGDDNPCTMDACDDLTDVCEFTNLPLGTACETDTDLCTTQHCNGSGVCVVQGSTPCSGPTNSCDGGTACNPSTGVCEALPDAANGTACDRDNNLCTNDTCDGAGNCVAGPSTSCSGPTNSCDGGQVCNPVNGLCEDAADPPLSTNCEQDGNLCTIEHCNGAGSCVVFDNVSCPGPSGPCDGGTACTPATGLCDALPDSPSGTACDLDGNLCTIDECNGTGSCVNEGSVSCQAANPPCEAGEVCNPGTGSCDPLPDAALSTPCQADASLCTLDHCDGNGACVHFDDVACPGSTGTCDAGTACTPATGACDPLPDPPLSTPCEADGNLCTNDHCNGTGSCVFLSDVSCPGPTEFCDGGKVCNPGTGACDDAPDAPLSTPCQADASQCTIDHCNGAGSCVTFDNVVCPGPTGTCDAGTACTPATGACDPLPDPPLSTPCESDGDLCTHDHCNGNGSCVTFDNVVCPGAAGICDAGQQCVPATGTCANLPDPPLSTPCEQDGNLCTNEHCDGNGSCVFLSNVSCPGPTGTCDAGTACTPATGACDPLPDPPLSTACEGDGNLCTIEHCNGSGSCVPFDVVSCPGSTGTCDAGTACTPATGACDPLPDPPLSTPCEADGNLCSLDHCNGTGSCVNFDNVVCPGPTGVCDSGTVCTPATGACDPLPDPPLSTPCEADGNLCTNDHCNGTGSCVFLSDVSCPGPTGQCDGGTTCDPGSGSCVDVTDPPLSTPCEADGNFCTIDHCNGAGACVTFDFVTCAPPLPPCESGEVCTPATGTCDPLPDAPINTPCDRDDDLCTIDRCDGNGMCEFHMDVVCADPNPPCEAGEVCVPSTGFCTELPDAPLSTHCERDGDLCTIDHCNGTGNCVTFDFVPCPGAAHVCDGGTVCQPSSGACVDLPEPPLSTPCEADGSLCTIDHCDGQGTCVTFDLVSCPGPTGVCDGGTSCTPATGQCDPSADPPLSTPCEQDSNYCTIEHCDGQGACVPFDDVDCPGSTGTCDGGFNCDPFTGTCEMLPDPPAGTSCNTDGNLCTLEVCDGLGGCVPAGVVTCPGSTGPCDAGTACNPSSGDCDALPDPASGTPCDRDGNLCTIDQCDGQGVCEFVGDVTCQDPNPPCEGGEVCNPATGACDPLADAPLSTSCEADDDLCTLDHCDGQGACVTFGNVTCQPAKPPCESGAACEPGTGLCVPLPDAPTTTVCERDGNLCTIDRCNGKGQCVQTGDVPCAGPVPPCEAGELCQPATGTCVAQPDAPSGTPCDDDGDACTSDMCNGSGSCSHPVNDMCGGCCLPGSVCRDDLTASECVQQGGTDHSGSCGGDADNDGVSDVCDLCMGSDTPDRTEKICCGTMNQTCDTDSDCVGSGPCLPACQCGPIPTMSEWGLVLLTLLLLTIAKLAFGTRRAAA